MFFINGIKAIQNKYKSIRSNIYPSYNFNPTAMTKPKQKQLKPAVSYYNFTKHYLGQNHQKLISKNFPYPITIGGFTIVAKNLERPSGLPLTNLCSSLPQFSFQILRKIVALVNQFLHTVSHLQKYHAP